MKPANQGKNMRTPALLRALALGLPLVLAACGGTPEQSAPADTSPTTTTGVRYHDDGLGISFEHSPDFVAVQFAPPDNIQDALNAAMLPGDHSWPIVGLVEKRLAQDLDPQAIRYREVPAIVLERYPACPPPSKDFPGGMLEACMAGEPVQRIGKCKARELIGYPGGCGWGGMEAFYWVVPLPACRRMLPPEKGMAPISIPIPQGWLLIDAPIFFKPDADAPADAEPRPTGYDREIRHILETLTTDASTPSA